MRRLARRIADLQARLLLSLLYYTLVAPFALAMRFTAKSRRGGWQPRQQPGDHALERAGRQY